jgi:hypothetical protein
MNPLNRFRERLFKIGIEIELSGNYPWVYLDSVNGNKVTEKYLSKYKFTLGFNPVSKGESFRYSDFSEIFKLIRKYVNKNKI